MRHLITLFIAGSIVLMITGCSGRVQTNPLPDQNKIYIPKGYKAPKIDVNETALEHDFDRYVQKVFGDPKKSDIFDRGYRRIKYLRRMR